MIESTIYSEAHLTELMHRHGVRPSAQRISVLSFVANGRTHPTAEEIYSTIIKEFPSLSKTTVYNSLHTLVDAGLIRELEIEAASSRYDFGLFSPHCHFSCKRCGKIFDVEMPDVLQSYSPKGFNVDTVDIVFKGVCPDCDMD